MLGQTRRFVSRRRALAVAALPIAFVAVAACGGGSSSGGTSGGSDTSGSSTTITIKNFMFSPQLDTVKAGATITVKNEDSTAHTLTATSSAGASFDTGNIGGGQSKTFTAPTKPGDYSYLCSIHNQMTGMLKVS